MCFDNHIPKMFFTKLDFEQELNRDPFGRFTEKEILDICSDNVTSENFILFQCANNNLGTWLRKPRYSDIFDSLFFIVFESEV